MLLLSVTSILLHSVAGLSDPLQRLRAEFNPEDRWNEAWLDKVHEWVEPMTDQFTFDEVENTKGDEGRLPEHDAIEMTEDLYRELFFGPNPTKTKWVISFVKKRRSQQHLWMCQYVVNIMRILADEYQGEVRFAYIISQKQEKLKEIFDVKTLPNTFLIEDGVAIEQNMLNVLYNQLYNFIEVGPKRDKQIYQSFPTPRVINDVELRIKYVYNYVFDKWHKDHGKDYTIGFLNTLKVPFTTGGGLEKDEEQNVWEIIEPQVREHFLSKRPDVQAIYLCYLIVAAGVCVILSLGCLGCCIKKRCCGGNKVAQNEKHKTE